MKKGHCRSCNAPILWIDLNGKAHPIDEKPVKRIVLDIAQLDTGEIKDTYVSHFSTCPQANKWRKNK